MRSCPTPERLRLLLDDGLSGTELAALSQHLGTCAGCRDALDRLSADPDSSRWRRLRGRPAGGDEPSDALLHRLERVGPPPSWTSRSRRAAAFSPPSSPAGYELLAEVGRGGVGVVYQARHLRLNRVVALKVLLSGDHAGAEDRVRFQAEAEAVSRLQHPNIVQIHDVGEHDGRPFLALEFVEGRSLAAQAGGVPRPPRVVADLVETLARAVHYAHEHGVIHRDLKPANVLVVGQAFQPDSSVGQAFQPDSSPDGRLESLTYKITDFGLAKLLDRPGQTETGRILGTPSYMAPEQARGQSKSVGPATDVYALGAILYELLTGRPPFHGVTSVDTIVQVLHDDPVPPRRLQPSVPRDLETICLKCLHKLPAQRYGSAAELADELVRFLDGRPVRARRLGWPAQAGRWCRRNPALAGLAAALLAAVAVGFAGVIWGYVGAEHARGQAEIARDGEARQRDRAELALYYSRIALAEREWLANNVARASYLLDLCRPQEGQPDRRGWEWHYLNRLCHADLLTFQAHAMHVRCISYSRDGKHLFTAAGLPDYTRTGQAQGELVMWDAATGRRLGAFTGFQKEVFSVAISPDGGRLLGLCSDNKAYLWDVTSRRPIVAFDAPAQFDRADAAAAFSPDGQTLAIPNREVVELRHASDGRLIRRLLGHHRYANVVAFNRDGGQLASADAAGVVRVWDVAAGREQWRISGATSALAFSPDGKRLAVSAREAIRLYEAASGRELAQLRGHDGLVRGLAWLPGGKQLASAATDQTVRLWEVAAGRPGRIYRGHTSGVLCVACSPDGLRLSSGDERGVVKVWDVERDQRALQLPPVGGVCALTFSADGQRVLTASNDGGKHGICAFDVASGTPAFEHSLRVALRIEWPLKYLDFSADGQRLAGPWRPDPTVVCLWDASTGKEAALLRGHRAGMRVVAFSRDGKRLATAAWDRKSGSPGELIVWDLDGDGRGTQRFVHSTASPLNCLAFSPDGLHLFGGERGTVVPGERRPRDGRIAVWEVQTGRRERSWAAHTGSVQSLAVSPDGRTLASAGRYEERGVRLWDAATGELLHALQAPASVTVVTFTPDGRRLAAAGYEGVVQLWDPATGQDILTLRGPAARMHENEANDTHIAFSPDGTRLAVNCWTKAIHVFDRSGQLPAKEADGDRQRRTANGRPSS